MRWFYSINSVRPPRVSLFLSGVYYPAKSRIHWSTATVIRFRLFSLSLSLSSFLWGRGKRLVIKGNKWRCYGSDNARCTESNRMSTPRVRYKIINTYAEISSRARVRRWEKLRSISAKTYILRNDAVALCLPIYRAIIEGIFQKP